MQKLKYTYKNYKKDIKCIYKIKDNQEFEKKITELYNNNEIKNSWKLKSLKKLLAGEKNYIELIVLIVSNLIAALSTFFININAIDEAKTQGISVAFYSFNFVLILLIIIGLLLLAVILIIVAPVIMSTISSDQIERRNIEINAIYKKSNKKTLTSVFEKENKKALLIKLICETIIGIIAAFGATTLVWFII